MGQRVLEETYLYPTSLALVPGHLKLNPKSDSGKWLSDKAAPWAKLANEKPKGETVAYDTLLEAWKAGRVR